MPLSAPGTAHRHHCPHCPHCPTSLHLDDRTPGARRAGCPGWMAPLGLTVRPDGEWMIIHRRPSCGRVGANRIAGDDNALVLLRMALRPLTGDRLRAGLRLSV